MEAIKIGKAKQVSNKGIYRLSYWLLRKKGLLFNCDYLENEPKLNVGIYKDLDREYQKHFKRNSGRNYEFKEEAIEAFYQHLKKLGKSQGWEDHYNNQNELKEVWKLNY